MRACKNIVGDSENEDMRSDVFYFDHNASLLTVK